MLAPGVQKQSSFLSKSVQAAKLTASYTISPGKLDPIDPKPEPKQDVKINMDKAEVDYNEVFSDDNEPNTHRNENDTNGLKNQIIKGRTVMIKMD